MSFGEIKREIDRLSLEERQQLESFLKAKRSAELPTFRSRVEAAHRRMDAGDAVSSAELRALLNIPQPAAG